VYVVIGLSDGERMISTGGPEVGGRHRASGKRRRRVEHGNRTRENVFGG
jgi:hypothetical protein